jgi:hypothetical protein
MASEMGFKIDPTILSVFYIATGIAEVGYFAIESSAAPPHIPVLGIFSILTAYSLFKMRKWSVLLVAGLFFTGITFGATTLNTSIIVQTFGGALLFHLALIAYMVLLTLAFVYVMVKRSEFS